MACGLVSFSFSTQNSFLTVTAFQQDGQVVQVLVQQNAEMREQLRVITAMLQEVLRRQRNIDGPSRGKLPDSVQLPLKDYSSLEALEQRLGSHQELKKQLVWAYKIQCTLYTQ